jgi:hypothetical protein
MKRLAVLVLLCGCDTGGEAPAEPTAPAEPAAAAAPSPTPAAAPTEAGLMPAEPSGIEAGKLAEVAALLPKDWSGTGVLETRSDAPKGAPAWAKVVAEVVDENGQRWLRTSGIVDKVSNKALAKSTAEARARAAMAKWLGTERLVGTEVVDHWQKKKNGAARARLAVPADWKPGQALPAPSDAAAAQAPH